MGSCTGNLLVWGVPGCSGWALLLLESNGVRKGEGDREHAMPSERREKERVLAMRELCVSTSHAGILCLEPQMKRAKAPKRTGKHVGEALAAALSEVCAD